MMKAIHFYLFILNLYNDGLKFVVLMMMKKSIVVLWAVTPCRFVGGYRHFGGTYRHSLQEQKW
jgi:hypothetical protein